MNEIAFFLNISAEDYLRYYQGIAQAVIVYAADGRRVQFPASNLRRFVTNDGVRGAFRLRFDRHHKLIEMCRIEA